MSGSPRNKRRSDCPLSVSLEIVGDRWSLLVMRDILFKGRRTFQEFLDGGEEMATNILADRLKQLQFHGIIACTPDPNDGRRNFYAPTAKGIALAPVLIEMIIWAADFEDTAAPVEVIAAMKRDRAAYLQAVLVGGCDGAA